MFSLQLVSLSVDYAKTTQLTFTAFGRNETCATEETNRFGDIGNPN